MKSSLQWGGRFRAPPDPALIAFGSSLEEDLPLAPFDVRCSKAHVIAQRDGGVISEAQAKELLAALEIVADEIESGRFTEFARKSAAEDIHGAIDLRVRELAPKAGPFLHAGRSRNDQVATTLLLYAADRAAKGKALALKIASRLIEKAKSEAATGTMLAGTTHWQPAQPISLAFWLCAAAEPFVRDARRFAVANEAALSSCPLGSGAISGSSLPLDRNAACGELGFAAPSDNAMDAIGNRDVALDCAHAFVRALSNASRICEELIVWCTPAYGYATLGDAASTGSSLMPQKRNPDPLELVRARAADLSGRFAGALAAISGIALSYHRDLQVVKGSLIAIIDRAYVALDAFDRALGYVTFHREHMNESAGKYYTTATDVADMLIANGIPARDAHAYVGEAVSQAEEEGRELNASDIQRIAARAGVSIANAPLDASSAISAKKTSGSTSPSEVAKTIESLDNVIVSLRTTANAQRSGPERTRGAQDG